MFTLLDTFGYCTAFAMRRSLRWLIATAGCWSSLPDVAAHNMEVPADEVMPSSPRVVSVAGRRLRCRGSRREVPNAGLKGCGQTNFVRAGWASGRDCRLDCLGFPGQWARSLLF